MSEGIKPIDLRQNTVFVIGAGASKPYGFPLGDELKEKIISVINSNTLVIRNKFEPTLVTKFIQSLTRTEHRTIDSFLEKRTNFRDIGSYAIAQSLLFAEQQASLFPPRDWYQHLFHYLDFENDYPETDNVSFVTLNYDRSFEYFFPIAIEDNLSYKLRDKTKQKFQRIKIFHIHGSLGNLNEVEFGANTNEPSVIQKAAQNIYITSDKIDDSVEYKEAQNLIKYTENLVFIGFGYDKSTLERLIPKYLIHNKRTICTFFKMKQGSSTYLKHFFDGRILSGNLEILDPSIDAAGFCRRYLPLNM
jgi:hypothetical protein